MVSDPRGKAKVKGRGLESRFHAPLLLITIHAGDCRRPVSTEVGATATLEFRRFQAFRLQLRRTEQLELQRSRAPWPWNKCQFASLTSSTAPSATASATIPLGESGENSDEPLAPRVCAQLIFSAGAYCPAPVGAGVRQTALLNLHREEFLSPLMLREDES